MTHVPITDLTFGVELEVIMPRTNGRARSRDDLAAFLTERGHDARHEQYNHTRRTWWKIVTDASLGYENAEVVAPILSGEAGLAEVSKMCKSLEDFGCRVSRACGTHVHVGVRDRFGQQIGFFKELLQTYAKFQPVIDQLLAPSRRGRNNTYCQPITWTPQLAAATTLQELGRLAGAGHFANPNFYDAFSRHGTVEFRQHQGTLNGEKLTNWIKLCLRLVAHAAKNDEPTRESTGEFRPPPRPVLPAPPRFTTAAPRDWNRGTRVTGNEIPRFITYNAWELRNLVITHVIERTPRRTGTAGRENHDRHNVAAAFLVSCGGEPMNLWAYHSRGGRRTHLAWDVDHGYVHVVRRDSAPEVALSAEEIAQRMRLTREHDETCARLNREHETAVAEARRAWEASRGTVIAVSRPPTDTAPTTLDGLMELIGADPTERAYFAERQLELNAT